MPICMRSGGALQGRASTDTTRDRGSYGEGSTCTYTEPTSEGAREGVLLCDGKLSSPGRFLRAKKQEKNVREEETEQT